MAGNIKDLEQKLQITSDPRKKVDILNSLAWNKRYGDTKMALKYSKQARILSEENLYKKGLAYSQLYTAICSFLLSKKDKILERLFEALNYFENSDEKRGLVISLNFTGNVYESYGDYEKGLKYCQKALSVAQDIEYEEGEGDTLSTIGLIYSRLSDYRNALESYTKSLKIREKTKNYKAAASSLNLIARTNTLLGNFSEALQYYDKSLKIRTELKLFSALPWTLLGIASTYEKMGNNETALKNYLEGLKLNIKTGDKRYDLQCYLGIGRIYLKLDDQLKALDYLQKAMKNAKALNAKPLLYETHKVLAEYYELTGDLAKALENHKKYNSLKEEVLNAETHNKLIHQQIDFAIERARKEAEIFQLKNVELKAAFNEIEKKNVEITDSIEYAERIQSAVMPPENLLSKSLPGHFILFKPKDIVSGDFYWLGEKDNKIIVTAADCTGHGVPGAFMSLLGVAFLNEIVNKAIVVRANEILNQLRGHVKKSLHQVGSGCETRDGIEMALCVFDLINKKFQYSGAYSPLYLIRNKELTVIAGDKMPIGISEEEERSFNSTDLDLRDNDVFYMFSDGYVDQLGGPNRKTFRSKYFKELLIKVHGKDMNEQKKILERTFDKWKGDIEQIDDILVIGIKI